MGKLYLWFGRSVRGTGKTRYLIATLSIQAVKAIVAEGICFVYCPLVIKRTSFTSFLVRKIQAQT
jgi:hypothetical protein